MVPLLKFIYYILFLGSLLCCYGESSAVESLQKYILMFLVVSETVTRTAIGVFFFLISKVSLLLFLDLSVRRAGGLSDSILTHLKQWTAPNLCYWPTLHIARIS